MSSKCAIIPKVKNKKGEIVDSRLFKDLLSFTNNNRAQAVKVYEITKSTEFTELWTDKLELDSNNEPTLKSLLKKTNLSQLIPEEKVLERLNRTIGHYKRNTQESKLVPNTRENYNELIQKAIEFNNQSEFKDDYVAIVESVSDKEEGKTFLNLKVEKKNAINTKKAAQAEYSFNLNEKLKKILSDNNISIGALTELEKRIGVNGVTDFDIPKQVAKGIIELIRLADGKQGEMALPEEFAHFALEAMKDQKLAERLINYLNSAGLVKEILGDSYDDYYSLYEGSDYKLAKEAAGKLLAKHLLQAESIPAKPYRNILQRVIDSIKNFFKTLKASEFQRAIMKADKDFGDLATNILNQDVEYDVSSLKTSSGVLFKTVEERVKRDKNILSKIIDNEEKRLAIYKDRNPEGRFKTQQESFISSLEDDLQNNREIDGIYKFIEKALEQANKLNEKLNSLSETEMSMKEKASLLRDIRTYIHSYKNSIQYIRTSIIEEESENDNRYEAKVKARLGEVNELIADLEIKYQNISIPLFMSYIKQFVGDSIEIPFGKYKGKKFTIEEILLQAENDIGFFDRWLDSMADSNSITLKLFDKAVKQSKAEARFRTIELAKEIKAASIELEQAGIHDTQWMFEVDENGNLTGDYIQEIDINKFKRERDKLMKNLSSKYGPNPTGQKAIDYNRERQSWYSANTELVNGIRVPKKSLYTFERYSNLNEAQIKYYNTIMRIKEDLDSYLPPDYTYLTNAVKIRKDLVERVKNSQGIREGVTQIWESIKDQFIRRSDDTDIGIKATMKDFENNEVQKLPIYFTKMKEGENMNDLSTDVTSTMIAYASMAIDYDEMNKVVDILEIGRTIIREKEVVKTQGDNKVVEIINTGSRKIINNLIKRGNESNLVSRLNDFFEMQVYHRYMADEGTFGNTKIDKAKTANLINKLTVINTLALNALNGISNVATGRVMLRIDAVAGELLNERDVIKADKIYFKELVSFLGDIGSRIKTSKLYLWNEYFNTLQEYETDVMDVNFDRKSWFSRMFSSNTLFFMQNIGEHWLQTRTSLALANSYKMKDNNGNIVSLWDAMETVYINPDNPSLGTKLQVKEGYTKLDGTKFTEKDAFEFERKSAGINERLHGIYNKADRNAFKKVSIGRLAMLYRNWIKPSINRRFKEASYNLDMDTATEGYYRTSLRFLLTLANDLRKTQFDLGARWDELSKHEKTNIYKALVEVSHLVVLSLILGLISFDDDKDKSYYVRMVEYQLRRLYTEIGSMVPGKSMLTEGFRILKSPAAGISTVENTLDLLGLLNPYNYELFGGEDAVLKSGRYKGHNRATKILFDSPIIPMNKTIYRNIYPEEAIPFYKQ